jgi:hypothetical protein
LQQPIEPPTQVGFDLVEIMSFDFGIQMCGIERRRHDLGHLDLQRLRRRESLRTHCSEDEESSEQYADDGEHETFVEILHGHFLASPRNDDLLDRGRDAARLDVRRRFAPGVQSGTHPPGGAPLTETGLNGRIAARVVGTAVAGQRLHILSPSEGRRKDKSRGGDTELNDSSTAIHAATSF